MSETHLSPHVALKKLESLQLKKPYQLLLYAGIVLILMSFLELNQTTTFDLHLRDTYFVIAGTHIFWLLAILTFFLWTLYLLTSKILYSKTLTWIHVIVTILTLTLFLLILCFGERFLNPLPRRYYDFSQWNSYSAYNSNMKAIVISIFVLLSGQIIFVVNLIAGLITRNTLK